MVDPDPTQPTKKLKNLDPTQPMGQPNPWTTLHHFDSVSVQDVATLCNIRDAFMHARQPVCSVHSLLRCSITQSATK